MNKGFTQFMLRANHLHTNRFKEWIFLRGMTFRSPYKWWGDYGMRKSPHEGLDLCLYRDVKGQICHLGHGTKIPAMCDGVIVKITDDFLGKTVVLEHLLPNKMILYIFYGHTMPWSHLSVGNLIKQGELLGTISRPKNPGTRILPHLHITIAQSAQPVSPDNLQWNKLGESRLLHLLDPIDFLECEYAVLENIACLGNELGCP